MGNPFYLNRDLSQSDLHVCASVSWYMRIIMVKENSVDLRRVVDFYFFKVMYSQRNMSVFHVFFF